jgi:hypothetical protein
VSVQVVSVEVTVRAPILYRVRRIIDEFLAGDIGHRQSLFDQPALSRLSQGVVTVWSVESLLALLAGSHSPIKNRFWQ